MVGYLFDFQPDHPYPDDYLEWDPDAGSAGASVNGYRRKNLQSSLKVNQKVPEWAKPAPAIIRLDKSDNGEIPESVVFPLMSGLCGFW